MNDHTTHNQSPKLCECGCGLPAPIAKKTKTRCGHVKGQPTRFIRGHHVRITPIKPVKSIADRFWEKVDKSNPGGCWLWTRSTFGRARYGVLNINGHYIKAHRVSYELNVGVIPEGMQVLHKCDVTLCVRPDHLFLGSQADNVHDMIQKGRTSCIGQTGDNNPKKRLKKNIQTKITAQ